MLPSKFPDRITGEPTYWCPDCNKEKKSKWADKPQDNTEELIFRQQMKEGLKIINENIQKIIELLKEK